ncbi:MULTISPECIES: DUF2827 domain-containing protein [Xanthomonas]|uniref:DUF2827 domain-containing protein n=1 Tax=Xanthomonas sacchari TaxID=56458 RepID=A0ABT3DTY2_9XANT|nr:MULTISPECIES: DUF2827 domain-containing protein [Xanthomonas]MCW0393838.1 hypothetical protein [Xanthomonas sacchari]MCW0398826.1 hypothetical protein [Xanthomonas sacchari]MCW0418474.1 hypothetical protein [Xanthomonas sacchari]MCW0443612.1 hypothetical protein [Xanthomonas sacchari]UYK72467.1 DUF2827 domain-containing protein [Xanthomonas sacchari]
MTRTAPLRVGVTLFLRSGQQSLWENGIFQNCYFLVQLLQLSPEVASVHLVNGGDGDPAAAGEFLALAPAPIIDMDTAQRELDVVIELSAQLNPQWACAFRSRGGRVVGMHVANDYVIDIERMMFDRPAALLMSEVPYDVLWTLPAFEKTCASYYRVAMRAPVVTMQHLWSPSILERTLAAQGRAGDFGYVPGRARWRLAVFEPNVCMVKTSHLPMLLCDAAYRRRPERFAGMQVYNTLHMKESPMFVRFARSLDMVNHGVATFEPRLPIYDVMGRHADAIVSHHWENAQNYLYYEALYGGYPLIHNSDQLLDCGYRYPDFDCKQGALALLEAVACHDRTLDDYRRRAAALLARLDPCAEANVRQYGAQLRSLFA